MISCCFFFLFELQSMVLKLVMWWWQTVVESVKEKLWRKCGTSVGSMKLELYDDMGEKVCGLDDNARPLGFYSPHDGSVVFFFFLLIVLKVCYVSVQFSKLYEKEASVDYGFEDKCLLSCKIWDETIHWTILLTAYLYKWCFVYYFFPKYVKFYWLSKTLIFEFLSVLQMPTGLFFTTWKRFSCGAISLKFFSSVSMHTLCLQQASYFYQSITWWSLHVK